MSSHLAVLIISGKPVLILGYSDYFKSPIHIFVALLLSSNNAAAMRIVSSSHLLPMICIPIGSWMSGCSAVAADPHGTLSAGWPVTLKGHVLLVTPIELLSLSNIVESGSGCGMARVGAQGVIKTSTSSSALSYAARSSNTLRCAFPSSHGPNLRCANWPLSIMLMRAGLDAACRSKAL